MFDIKKFLCNLGFQRRDPFKATTGDAKQVDATCNFIKEGAVWKCYDTYVVHRCIVGIDLHSSLERELAILSKEAKKYDDIWDDIWVDNIYCRVQRISKFHLSLIRETFNLMDEVRQGEQHIRDDGVRYIRDGKMDLYWDMLSTSSHLVFALARVAWFADMEE